MMNELQQAKDEDGDDEENLPFIRYSDQKAPWGERNMHSKDLQQVTLTKNKTSPAISTNFPDCFHVWSFPVQMDPIAEEKIAMAHGFVVNSIRNKSGKWIKTEQDNCKNRKRSNIWQKSEKNQVISCKVHGHPPPSTANQEPFHSRDIDKTRVRKKKSWEVLQETGSAKGKWVERWLSKRTSHVQPFSVICF